MHALADGSGHGRLHVPDRPEDLEQVSACHLRDRHLADARECVALQAAQPDFRVLRIAPTGLLLFHHRRGSLGEARHALGAPLFCERVAALAGQLAVGQRFLTCFGERDQDDAAESELAPPAPDDEALDPTPGSARLDEEVQAVAVRVPPRWGCAHEGGRQCLVGMATPGLGFPWRGGRVYYSTHPHIIQGIKWM